MATVIDDRVNASARLAAVARTGLLDTSAEEPFDRLTRLACQLLGAPFGFVTIVDDRRSFWKSCVGTTAVEIADRQNPVGESFCQYVIAADAQVIIGDARLNPMTADNPSIASMGVIAWAGFPVRSPDGEVLGSFCVVDGVPREWTPEQVSVLEVLAHAASGEVGLRIGIDEARTAAAAAAEQAAKSASLAATLRESLLPPRLPDIEGLDIAAVHVPGGGGEDVLGDFYDVVPTTNGAWSAFVGDVSGKGVAAARTTALTRYTLRASALAHSSPVAVLHQLHQALATWFAEIGTVGFVTVAYSTWKPAGDGYVVRVTTAGHPPAIIRRADGTRQRLASTGTVLGCLPKVRLGVTEDTLHPGDSLILYTDGVTEARHRTTRGFLDVDGYDAMLAATAATTSAEIAADLKTRLLAYSEHPTSDDIAIVVITVRADGP
jgi:sigma-B regulation protein RsbU (phosphoserine phosphatase)